MNNKLLCIGVSVFFLLTGSAPGAVFAQSSSDFDDHWLAAACTQVPVGGRLVGQVSDTEYGVAIGPVPRRTLVLYCNVDADVFHNQIQLVAEDNSPNVQVTATLFQQEILIPGAAPTVIVSVSTEDKPGLQAATVFFDPPLVPDELFFMYFVKIEVVRRTRDPVLVYSVSMQDVL